MRSRIGKTAHYRGEEFITCQEVITFLLEYLSKDLSPEEEQHFERHLAICPSCVAYLKAYRQTVHLGRVALRREVDAKPPELGVELVRAILQARA
ncbi:MAG: zf-HC2 domain-containing protein [Thermoanaerobaculia bacterium]